VLATLPTSRPFISFVVPSYQMAPYLQLTLESLKHVAVGTTGIPFEVVVVDDGSTDQTPAVIDAARTTLPMLRSVRRARDQRSCRSLARNTGAAASQGDHLVFLDAGVMVRPGFLSALARAWAAEDSSNDVQVISTLGLFTWSFWPDLSGIAARFRSLTAAALAQVLDSLALDPAWCERRLPFFTLTAGDLSRLPAPWLFAWSAALGVSRRLFDAAGGFDESFVSWGVEDCDFGLSLAQAGARFRALACSPVLHVPHPIEDPQVRRQSHLANARRLQVKRPNRETELFAALEDPFAVNRLAMRFDREAMECLLPPWDAGMVNVAENLLQGASDVLFLAVPQTHLCERFPRATWGVPSRNLHDRLISVRRAKLTFGAGSDEPSCSREAVVVTDLVRLLPPPLQIAQFDGALRLGRRVWLFCAGRGPGWPDASPIHRELAGWSLTSLDKLAATLASAGIALNASTRAETPLLAFTVTRVAASP
jgi:glycosyltransferase involved in cell wall biosynthesis